MIAMEGVEPWSDPEDKRDPGDLFGILFQVSIILDIHTADPGDFTN